MFGFNRDKLLFVVSFIDILAVSLLVPLLGHHLKSNGYSNFMIGLIGSSYSCVQFISSPIVGYWSDKYGRKLVLVFSLLISSICYTLLGMNNSFLWILTFRMLIGSAKHTILLCKGIVEDEKPEAFQLNYGRLSGTIALSFIVGPIIGGYLVDKKNGFAYICTLTGLLTLLNSAVVYFFMKNNEKKIKSSQLDNIKSEESSMISSIKNIPWACCWDIFLIKMVSTIVAVSFLSNYNLALREQFKVSSVIVGYTYSFQGIVGACTGFSIIYVDKLFPKSVNNFTKMQIGYFLFATTFLLQYISNQFYIFVLSLIPLNIISTFLRITNNELLLDNSKIENRGLIMGTFNNVTSVSRSVMPLITGMLIDLFGYNSIYLLCSVISVFGIIITKWRCNYHLKTD